jgi:RNA polymerase sigma-70 factor, ECF subfamily
MARGGCSPAPRDELCAEAVRLGRVLRPLLPEESTVAGLLALMLLIQSRRAARVDASGALVPLAEQDRARWDRALIDEGLALVRECLRRNAPCPYQIQAAINAVHAHAATAADTDWPQILALYDQLLTFGSSDVVRMNRAIVVAEVEGPAAGLEILDRLDLDDYHLLHAARADMLAKLGRAAEAVSEYERAIGLTQNEVERAFLRGRVTPRAAPCAATES